MPNLPDPSPTVAPATAALDYSTLLQQGIQDLQRLAGSTWTDHNAHDPGITILEQFCYALTDLGYRLGFDLKDLVASAAGTESGVDFSPADCLQTNPVTLTDLRKVALDVPGVRNAWIEPVAQPDPPLYFDPTDRTLYLQPAPQRRLVAIRGLYRVLLEADAHASVTDVELRAAVRRRLLAVRNLGEDFLPPVVLAPRPVTIRADLEVGEVSDPTALLAAVYRALADVISPRLTFRSRSELERAGQSTTDIFDGPPLTRGFLADDELEGSERRTALRVSDLIHAAMEVEGVLAVRSLTVSAAGQTDGWYLELGRADELFAPFLKVEPDAAGPAGSRIRLWRGNVLAQPDAARALALFRAEESTTAQPPLPREERDLPPPTGRARRLDRYLSLQNQFPDVYGIGALGLPDSATDERRAQARQLKAYLTLFDQVLAGTFTQLAHAAELFAAGNGTPRSYFPAPLDTVPGLADVLPLSADEYATRLGEWAETPDQACARRLRFLQHVLARFGEDFQDAILLQAGSWNSTARLVQDMAGFLADYRQAGPGRCRAFDYSQLAWEPVTGSTNVSGLERRLSRKLGLGEARRRPLAGLSASDPGGFHLIEHVLLRPDPRTAAGGFDPLLTRIDTPFLAAPERDDPYSAQLSFVFPDWLTRFQSPAFREFVGKTLREETPAHLHFRLLWLKPDAMREFEAAYAEWLNHLAKAS